MRKPRVSIVIPAYKRTELLHKAVRSLFEQDLDRDNYELIVVDSSPHPRNVEALRELQAQAPCSMRFYVKQPEGPGPSRNLGAQQARGEILAFMDSDCQATPGWLRAGLAGFEDGVGIVQGKVLPDPAARRGIFTRYVVVEQDSLLFEAANIFYRRHAFEETCGFVRDLDPHADHNLGGEDAELGWQVKRNGWQTRFAPEALVYHEVLPISPLAWLFNKHLYIWPRVARRVPELRRFLFARYFYDRAQACLLAALAGIVLSNWSLAGLLLCAPYVWLRTSEPSQTLRGPLRLLRSLFYLPQDLISLAILTAGSLRHRSLVL